MGPCFGVACLAALVSGTGLVCHEDDNGVYLILISIRTLVPGLVVITFTGNIEDKPRPSYTGFRT